jgi:AcrR family transcriptional regulator
VSIKAARSAKRRYDGTGRQRDATERRSRIVDAAHQRFVHDGYSATSIDQIARDAGTSAQTVYAAFGNKAGILRRVVDVAIAGDHADVALIDRPEPQAVFRAPDVAARLQLAIDVAAGTHARSAHLIALTQSLAGSDPAVRELADDLERQVRIDTERFLGAAGGHLRDDLPTSHLVDITLLVTGPSSWHRLVNEAGWTPDEWRTWALEAMRHLVMAPTAMTARVRDTSR